jgi:Zn-dependent peptidase ImmA (M78 family)/transcriptional regulator with XRE-family HTH domain
VTDAGLFSGDRLTLARQLGALRKSELAIRVGKSATAIAAWEAGLKRPTSANINELALSLGVSPAFFAPRGGRHVPDSLVPHFRSLRATSQRARDQALAYGLVAADIADAIEKHVEFPAPEVPAYPVDLDNALTGADDAARQVRAEWGMPPGPAKHLVRLLEQHGILVVFSPEQASAVDAYSFDTVSRPVVVLNPVKNNYYRQRFDVAHELGHLVMHADAEPGSKVVEGQAHRFASELLMPADIIRDRLPATMNARAWDTLGALKEEWGVSIQALLYRARQLERLSDVSYRNAMMTLSQRGWRRDEPGLVTAVEQPSLLPRAVEMLSDVGVARHVLVDQARVPAGLFQTVISRQPLLSSSALKDDPSAGRVVSLLPRIEERRQESS